MPSNVEIASWTFSDDPRNFAELQELRTTGTIKPESIGPSVDWYTVAAENYDLLNVAKGRVTLLEAELKRRNQEIEDLQLTNRNLSRKLAYEIARSNGKQ